MDPVLTRGWRASDIRRAVLDATDAQRAVLQQIALHDGTTSEDIAGALGLKSPRSVGSTMAAWSRMVTTPMGITDPATGRTSWPFTYSRRGDGYWRYHRTDEVAAAILAVTGGA